MQTTSLPHVRLSTLTAYLAGSETDRLWVYDDVSFSVGQWREEKGVEPVSFVSCEKVVRNRVAGNGFWLQNLIVELEKNRE